MKYQAIIFDLDGTIIQSNHIWDKATSQILQKRGITLSPEDKTELAMRTVGLAVHKSCLVIKEIANLDDNLELLIAEKVGLAAQLYEQEIVYMHGFHDFHTYTQLQKLKTAIATNADDHTLEITKKKLNLADYFGNHIYNISHVGNRCKPDPDVYLHAAEQLGVRPKNCIAIEDSPQGIQAAKAAGMYCIGFNSSKNMNFVKEADTIVDAYHEINLGKFL